MEIRSAKYLVSSPRVELCPPPDKPEYAFIGRSNVGKSSLINMITGRQKLAKTSASPGKTQMINHFVVNDEWYIVDLPGYGYAKVSQKQRASFQKMISNYLNTRANLGTVFVLIDSRHSPQEIDLEFLKQLGDWGVPFNIIFTKADKSTQKQAAKNVRSFIETMKQEWEFIPRSFLTSAVKGLGKAQLLGYIEELNTEFNNNFKN